MSEAIGNIGFEDNKFYRLISDKTQKEIDNEVTKIIKEETERCRVTIEKHREEIEKLAEALLEKETLDLKTIIR